MSETITPRDLDAALQSATAPLLLDVRRAADRDAAAIPGAVWKDPEKVAQWAGELPAGAQAVIYCVRGGSVSASVSAALRERGVDVRYVAGGLEAWKKEHGSVRPDDVALLRAHGLSAEDVAHSVKVAEIALALAAELPDAVRKGLDLDLVARGAVLHDLGKGREKGLGHGEAGYQLALELGLPAEVAAIMDRHVLGGLTPEEAQAMGLPPRERALSRFEEKLVVYADKLTDILEETDHATSLADARARYEAILRADPGLSKHNPQALERYVRAGLDVEAAGAPSSST